MIIWIYTLTAITMVVAWLFLTEEDDDDQGGGTLIPVRIPVRNEFTFRVQFYNTSVRNTSSHLAY